ncbi:helix-turn-helix domain-containing protein [Wenjunlia tyrosinilytica]|uniref:HTH cro/C1-type domain-containing protein n=1 Tax=Wenjunlia tyrosinilytica TaxID=1544741 RepID=A0A917ZY73_9ACTN|nr:helix-turn-helix transcriptional regulator [Wenjunlia tyrosinilytica]GGO98228.1 hypothetical protein GCM10012280_61870 [Wenjunlia tyrosinilytica]
MTMAPYGGDDPSGESFVLWLREIAVSRGFDVSPRGGGRHRLAQEMGMSQSAIGRLIAGQTMPDVETLVRLARALHVSPLEMIIRSGKLSENDLPAVQPGPAGSMLSAEEAATFLGIADDDREVFVWMLRRMRRVGGPVE